VKEKIGKDCLEVLGMVLTKYPVDDPIMVSALSIFDHL